MYNEETINEVINLLAENKDINSISTILNIPPAIITSWKTKYQQEIKIYRLSKKIKQLVNLGQYNVALKLCNNLEFTKNPVIISQKITILIIKKKYKAALEICNYPEFQNHIAIISQKITILIKLKKFKKALAICNEPRFQNNPKIMSQKITVLIKLKDQAAALALCNRSEFKYDEHIQKQKAHILIHQGEYQKAFDICNYPEFQNCDAIQNLKAKLLKEHPELTYSKTIINSPKVYQDLLTLLKNNKLTLSELNNYPLSDFAKIILTIAYHELQNYPQNVSLNFLKKYKKEYQDNEIGLKIITKLLNHIKSKRNIFNFDFYLNLLNTPLEITPKINIAEEKANLLRLINILNIIKEEKTNNKSKEYLKR